MEISVWLIPGHRALLLSLEMNVFKHLTILKLNLVMTSDISGALFSVRPKTQISQYIKPVT